MWAVADGTELHRPLLPANNVALAIKVGELMAGEVTAAIIGSLQRARGYSKAASSNRGRRL